MFKFEVFVVSRKYFSLWFPGLRLAGPFAFRVLVLALVLALGGCLRHMSPGLVVGFVGWLSWGFGPVFLHCGSSVPLSGCRLVGVVAGVLGVFALCPCVLPASCLFPCLVLAFCFLVSLYLASVLARGSFCLAVIFRGSFCTCFSVCWQDVQIYLMAVLNFGTISFLRCRPLFVL